MCFNIVVLVANYMAQNKHGKGQFPSAIKQVS